MRAIPQIWLKQPLQTSEGRTLKLFPGLFVRVNRRSILEDVTPDDRATHVVKECFTTPDGFIILIKDVVTKESKTIKLKQL